MSPYTVKMTYADQSHCRLSDVPGYLTICEIETTTDWVAIIGVIVTTIGVLVALFISNKSLKETRLLKKETDKQQERWRLDESVYRISEAFHALHKNADSTDNSIFAPLEEALKHLESIKGRGPGRGIHSGVHKLYREMTKTHEAGAKRYEQEYANYDVMKHDAASEIEFLALREPILFPTGEHYQCVYDCSRVFRNFYYEYLDSDSEKLGDIVQRFDLNCSELALELDAQRRKP